MDASFPGAISCRATGERIVSAGISNGLHRPKQSQESLLMCRSPDFLRQALSEVRPPLPFQLSKCLSAVVSIAEVLISSCAPEEINLGTGNLN